MFNLSMLRNFLGLALIAVALSPVCSAQQPDNQSDLTIDAAARAAVIEGIVKNLNESYVFPDVAKKMETSIRAASKGYEQITSAKGFAETLTRDLQAVSNDKHLRVRYSFDPIPVRQQRGEPTATERDEARRNFQWRNHSFNKIERLPGNIGYMEFRGFFDPEFGGETVAAAMNFLNNTDALIIDLRQNGGGDPAMVALICSYFFGPEPVHLNDLYWRPANRTDEFWTRKEVPGKRYLNKEIYVLTSKRTFSGAEEFTYNLKNLKRATIVGEATGGGAHPGSGIRLSEHFGMFVPSGRAISPITKTNWEGTGVKPDVEVPADQALTVARLMALKKSVTSLTNPDFKAGVQAEIENLEKQVSELKAKK